MTSSSGTPIRRLWGRLELLRSATTGRSPCPNAQVLPERDAPYGVAQGLENRRLANSVEDTLGAPQNV